MDWGDTKLLELNLRWAWSTQPELKFIHIIGLEKRTLMVYISRRTTVLDLCFEIKFHQLNRWIFPHINHVNNKIKTIGYV